MSKIKITQNKYGELNITINVNVPIKVYIGDEDQLEQLKNMSEDELLEIIDDKIDNMERIDLGELVLNNLGEIDNKIERE
jgi:dephospho-CoA kinase